MLEPLCLELFRPLIQIFIGLKHVNLGFVEINRNYVIQWKTPIKSFGNIHYWFPFNDKELKASAELTKILQDKYKICGSLVIAHADAAIGRKVNLALMYNYKYVFDNFEAGYFPNNRQIS